MNSIKCMMKIVPHSIKNKLIRNTLIIAFICSFIASVSVPAQAAFVHTDIMYYLIINGISYEITASEYDNSARQCQINR